MSYKCESFNFYRLYEKNIILKNDTMNESQLQKMCNYVLYPRDSKVHSDKGFVNSDNGSMGGTQWTCFIVKVKKSFYFDSFGGQPDKLLLNQKSQPILSHN